MASCVLYFKFRGQKNLGCVGKGGRGTLRERERGREGGRKGRRERRRRMERRRERKDREDLECWREKEELKNKMQ